MWNVCDGDIPPVRIPRERKDVPPGCVVDRFLGLVVQREKLDQLRIRHLDIFRETLMAADGALFLPDFIIAAMLQRSYGIVDALIDAVDNYNIHAAAPLLRLQLDNLFRAHYFASAPDLGGLVERLLAGEELRRIKDIEGRPLNDYRLKQLAAGAHGWALPVYDNTSGWVHLSQSHIAVAVQTSDSSELFMGIPLRPSVIPESLWQEIYNAAIQSTEEFFSYVRGWSSRKGMPPGEVRSLD